MFCFVLCCFVSGVVLFWFGGMSCACVVLGCVVKSWVGLWLASFLKQVGGLGGRFERGDALIWPAALWG